MRKRTHIILSADLSLSSPAFCVLEVVNKEIRILHLSSIKTNSKQNVISRLHAIYEHAMGILREYDITEVVVEKGFNRFATATAQIQRVVGVFYLALSNSELDIYELSPTTVKKLITGSGKASKEEVAAGVEKYVGKINFKNNDESDAVAVGIGYALKKKLL